VNRRKAIVVPRFSTAPQTEAQRAGAIPSIHCRDPSMPVIVIAGRVCASATPGVKMQLRAKLLLPHNGAFPLARGTEYKDNLLTITAPNSEQDKVAKALWRKSPATFPSHKLVQLDYDVDTPVDAIFFGYTTKKTGLNSFCSALWFGPHGNAFKRTTVGAVEEYSVSGERIASHGRVEWSALESHPVFANNAAGSNDCVILGSKLDTVINNELRTMMTTTIGYTKRVLGAAEPVPGEEAKGPDAGVWLP
jgi:hypothetical protein